LSALLLLKACIGIVMFCMLLVLRFLDPFDYYVDTLVVVRKCMSIIV